MYNIVNTVILVVITCCAQVGSGQEMKYDGFTTVVFAGVFPDYTNSADNVPNEETCANNCINNKDCKGFQYCSVVQASNCNWWISSNQVLFGKPQMNDQCAFYYRPELPKDTFNSYRYYVEMKYYERSASPLPSGHVYWMERAVETLVVHQDWVAGGGNYSHSGYLNAPDMGYTGVSTKMVITDLPGQQEEILLMGDKRSCLAVYPDEETNAALLARLARAKFAMTPMNLTKIKEYVGDLTFVGSQTRRHIRTNVWSMNVDQIASYTVTNTTQYYYFSTPYWEGQSGNGNGLMDVPVAIEVDGILTDSDSNGVPFILRYDLVDYRPMQTADFELTDFQAGKHTLCTSKKPGKLLPELPNAFSTRLQETYRVGEESSSSTYRLTNRHVYYDFPHQLHRIVSLDAIKGTEDYTVTNIIHDFNTDLSYYIGAGDPPTTTGCSIRRLTTTDNDFPDVNTTDSGLYLITTQALFNLDNAQFQYRGRELERGVLCDVWVGEDPDFLVPALGIKIPVIIEVYFMVQDSTSPLVLYGGKHIPLYMDVTSPDVDFDIRLHYYDVFESEPDFSHYDIGRCFQQSDLVDFQVTFSVGGDDASAEQLMAGKEKAFDQAFRLKIQELTAGSPIRFQHIKLSYQGNKVYAMARMSEQIPKDQYDPDKDTEKQNAAVYAELKSAVDAGNLVVTVEGDPGVTLSADTIRDDIIPMVTLAPPTDIGTTRDTTNGGKGKSKKTGYSTGAMAGLGLSMLILGLLLSAALLFVMKKFTTGSLFNRQSQQKLENDFSSNA